MVGGVVRNHGSIGVHAENGGPAVLVNDVLLSGNAFRGGLAGAGASIVVDNGVVEGSDIGLQAFTNGTVRLSGSRAVARNNGRFGLFGESGAVHLDRGARVANNGDTEVLLDGGTFLAQATSVIEENGRHGVDIGSGTAHLSGGSDSDADGVIVRNNHGDGIHIRGNGMARFFPFDATGVGATKVTGNGGSGMFCAPAPAVTLIAGSPGTVTGNSAGQIDCPAPAP